MTDRALPRYRPARRRDLIFFDLKHGLRVAVRELRKHLGRWQVTRVLGGYLAASLRDPLRDLDEEGWPADREPLVRHQLRAAVRLDDAIGRVVDDEERRIEILGDVVAATGAEFIRRILPLPDPDVWHSASRDEREQFIEDATNRFFNAEVDEVYAESEMLGFDVCRCRFVHLTQALGRPYLAPMFCRADSLYFSREASPVSLERTSTLARGGARCDFRFAFRDDASERS